jgi:hypothetical protein
MAFLYDGSSGVRHEVDVGVFLGDLVIERADGSLERVPVRDLSLVDRNADGLTIGRPAIDGWRLRVPAPFLPELDALFPRGHGYGGWIDRVGLWPAAAGLGVVSALILTFGYFAPTLLAPLVPASVEKTYGDALVGDFGGKYCSTKLGDAALKRLTAKLDANPDDLNVRVVDVPIVNAAALPANNIVLFDKLLETVETPEELAGILAHEIAHVRRRHVTAALIREFGVGIFAAAFGGTTGGNVDGFVSLSFTRRAEQEADDDAIARLTGAGISPKPTAAFFARLRKAETNLGRFEPALAYLSSHPLSGDRARRFETAARKGPVYTPALTSREWTELRAICSRRPPTG